tara:strand:+ start:263 stop:631 length:369 start_codon:yes stop_codon:yes gene_type:complete
MGLTLSTTKYSLEYSCLPKNQNGCCISLYNYEFLFTTDPSWFIYKELNTRSPKWLYYHGYIGNVIKDGICSTTISDLKLEHQSLKFGSLLELTNFLKSPATSAGIDGAQFFNINNNYINQLV